MRASTDGSNVAEVAFVMRTIGAYGFPAPTTTNMHNRQDEGIDPRLLDLRGSDVSVISPTASSCSVDHGLSMPRGAADGVFTSTTENDITLRNEPALKAIQRGNHEPWNHLYTLPTHAPQSPNCAHESTTFESDDDRYSRLQRARPSVDLPGGRWTEADFPPPEKLHGQRSQPTSGLSLLFAAGREPPVVDGTQESSGLNMPSVQQQWPDVDSSKTQEDCRWPGNAFDHHSADPAPSIIATDESYLEDGFWQEDHPFAFAVYDTATDIDDSSQAASQHRRPSFAEIDYQSTGYGNRQDLVGSPLVDEPHDGSHSQAFDNGLSNSDDLWTQPIAVPMRPTYNKYKPGIAASYPPAVPQHPRYRRSRSKRPLAPRYGDVVSECPTPQSKPLWTGNSLCIVHEDGKGGALVPPSTSKKGRRVGRYVDVLKLLLLGDKSGDCFHRSTFEADA
ncbi:MAG: hypothetical protein L6R35_000581 [Caloplaca aegaea]|nr:MAG: hypothetical protein L6R35_000581 [Caloplaca aegaea]